MPLSLPNLDDRRFDDLLAETLARIPVHTPEWTNYGPSDPGRTLVELFCFLTESLLYRANQIPERNRRKFLQLLDIPLRPGAAAQGLVAFANRTGPPQALTLNADLELRAGDVPFQTEYALDVLPVEGRVYYKRKLVAPSERIREYYDLLYASYRTDAPTQLELYEAVPLELREPGGVDLGAEAVDGSLWIALLARPDMTPEAARAALAGKTLSLGIVPALLQTERALTPAGAADAEGAPMLHFELPAPPAGGRLPADPALRVAKYMAREPRMRSNVLLTPGVVEITLPGKGELALWADLDPLEAGVGDFPPALEDTETEQRIVTWLRLRAASGATVRLLWTGINAVTVSQRARVHNELLTPGTGLPDQVRVLSRRPVVARSVQLSVGATGDLAAAPVWEEIDDLLAAGPEVDAPDSRQPPGALPPPRRKAEVFSVDGESGELRFGDGLRGRRPGEGASLVATYDYSLGARGNVARGAIDNGPALPAGVAVTNPVRTWGGADPETVAAGEKQIARTLQHRERLVSAADFHAVARRAPGVQIGRLEVLPAFHPDLSDNEPGDAPGVVTLMAIPSHDLLHPRAPRPDALFLNALCRHLDPRRLVTTELVLRGPNYVPVYVSIGIDIRAGHAVAEVREAVRARLLAFLAPVYADAGADPVPTRDQGWPLRKAVFDRELMAEASRVAGVLLVNEVLLAPADGTATDTIRMTGLDLPEVLGIAVQVGAAMPLAALRGQPNAEAATTTRALPVPFVPQEC